jgi:hypothetical protein
MSEPIGQILPESNFGRVLTRLAKNSNTIVELGCWRGGGSTKCLADGLVRPEQRMWSIDTSPQMIAEARDRNPDDRITFLCGTVLKPNECDMHSHGLYANHPLSKSMLPEDHRLSEAMAEMRACSQAPFIGDQLPEEIDLCLFDGGEYSTRFEFLKLYKRCRVIALDDIRKDVAFKNYRNHQSMMTPLTPLGWNLLFHRPYERNGWSVFVRVQKRPNGKLFPICNTLDDIDNVLR